MPTKENQQTRKSPDLRESKEEETQYTTLQAVQEALQAYNELVYAGTITKPAIYDKDTSLLYSIILMTPHEDDWQADSLNNRVQAMIAHLQQTLQVSPVDHQYQQFYRFSGYGEPRPTRVTQLNVDHNTSFREKLGTEVTSHSLFRLATSAENDKLLRKLGRPPTNESKTGEHDLTRSIKIYLSPTQDFASTYIQEQTRIQLDPRYKDKSPLYSLDRHYIPQAKQYPYKL